MIEGTIKSKNEKGFGFLTVEGYAKDVFFHASKCKGTFDSMQKGDTVEISAIDETEKGFVASGIKPQEIY